MVDTMVGLTSGVTVMKTVVGSGTGQVSPVDPGPPTPGPPVEKPPEPGPCDDRAGTDAPFDGLLAMEGTEPDRSVDGLPEEEVPDDGTVKETVGD